LFSCRVSAAQDSLSFIKERVILGSLADMEADLLGNTYLFSDKNQLKKRNINGDSMGVFNDVRRYGKLYTMDVSNPLKCILYYKNFATILILDRFLQPVNTIDLRRQSIFQVKAVAQSYDNKIWVYDEQNQQLKKINDDGQVLLSTPDLRMAFDEVPSPEKIVDQDGFVYLNDPEKGIYVFDIYGTFKTKLSYIGLRNFSVIGKTIAGVINGQLVSYTMGSFQEKRWNLPPGEQALKYVIQSDRLFVLKKDSLEIYKVKMQ
jgi:hypothetical protein